MNVDENDPNVFCGIPRWEAKEMKLLGRIREQLHEKLISRPQFPEVVGDRKLIRFMRANNHDFEKTCEAIEKFLDWRIDENIDEIRYDIIDNGMNSIYKFPYAKELFSQYLHMYNCTDLDTFDKEGRPIFWKDMLSPGVFDDVSPEDLLIYEIYCMEYGALVLEQLSYYKEEVQKMEIKSLMHIQGGSVQSPYSSFGVIHQFISVWDIDQMQLGHTVGMCKIVQSEINLLESEYYPHSVYKYHVINAGTIYKLLYKHMHHSVDNLVMHGNSRNFLKHLNQSQDIPISSIPVRYGGTLEICDDISKLVSDEHCFHFNYETESSPLYCPRLNDV